MAAETTKEAAPGGGTAYDDLGLIREELDRCMRCGNCMAVCPVYLTDRVEAGVTRGKIAVAEALLAGDLALDDPQVSALLFNCLVCKSCMQNCPTRVGFDRIILALRSALLRENGLPWLKKLIFSTLRHPRLFAAGMRAGALLQGLAFRDHTAGKAISPRAPLAAVGGGIGFDAGRLLPAPSFTPLRDRLPQVVTVAKPRARVVFFTGCSLNHFYPEAGLDIVEVLRENDVEVLIPGEQSCCGIPLLVHGDVETARTLARKNIDVIEQCCADYLVTGCGSCGGAWLREYREILAKDPLYAPKAELWAGRTHDISTFLTRVIDYRRPRGEVEAVVTYHDPCHLKKSMKVASEPREILGNIPGVTFREMFRPDACCGGGGSYMLSHYDTSAAIGRRKAEDISSTGARVVATGCPACMMQLLDNIHRFGSGQETRHYVSLLAESYRRERGE